MDASIHSLRGALELCHGVLARAQCDSEPVPTDDLVACCTWAEAALSAPPRNCDRFRTADEAWRGWNAWDNRGRPLVKSWRDTDAENFARWLFAPADKKEGGAG